MAAPYYQNKELIEKNEVAAFSSNYHLYGDLSMRVMDTLRALAGAHNTEVYSVDEAFLDLDMIPGDELYDAAKRMKEITEQWTGIKVSIGVAPTKVLSKVANKLSKKDKKGTGGIIILDSVEKIKDALESTPVDDLWGIGYRYANKLKNFGIENGWQLRNMPEEWCRKNLGGVVGVRMIRELKGIPCILMKDPLEVKKMIATTRMFGTPVHKLSDLKEAVATYASRAAEKVRRQRSAATFLDVFVVANGFIDRKYEYNPQSRHSHITLPQATSNTGELIGYAALLAENLFRPNEKYIKAGVLLGGLVPDNSIQSNLFMTQEKNRLPLLMSAIDNINFSMRDDVVKYVATGLKRNWKMRQQLRSKRYTTRWDELFEIR